MNPPTTRSCRALVLLALSAIVAALLPAAPALAVDPLPDLTVDSATWVQVQAGGSRSVEFTVRNNSSVRVADVAVTITLPVGSTFTGGGAMSGFFNWTCTGVANVGTCRGTVEAGNMAWVGYSFTATSSPGSYQVPLQVDAANAVAESNEANNTWNTELEVVAPDLYGAIQATGDSVAGGTRSYFVSFGDAVPNTSATNVTVSFTLDAGTFVDVNGSAYGYSCTFTAQTATCTGGGISYGYLSAIGVVVKLPLNGGLVELTAQIDPQNTVRESDETNNTVVSSVQLVAPELSIGKVGPPMVGSGERLQWALNFGNNHSTATAYDVTVEDELPAGVTYLGYNAGGGFTCSFDSATRVLRCTGGTIGPLGFGSILVDAVAPDATTILTNTARIDPNDVVDEQNEDDNSSTAITSVSKADQPAQHRLGDFIYNDLNQNGQSDPGEPGIGGVQVNLTNSAGNVVSTTITDTSGAYAFDVADGLWTVDADDVNFGDGGRLAAATATGAARSQTRSVNGADELTADFGFVFDGDGDGTVDPIDNCPATPNSDQADLDRDAIGDPCDGDRDGDAVPNDLDCSPSVVNAAKDRDFDGLDDVCDPLQIGDRVWLDADGDGIQDPGESGLPDVTVELRSSGVVLGRATTDQSGNYLFRVDVAGTYTVEVITTNLSQIATTPTSWTKAVGPSDTLTFDFGFEPDSDRDTVANRLDNCDDTPNLDQMDRDGDGIGDACDGDDDGDGIGDLSDNCAYDANTSQTDTDADGIGDACDTPLPGRLTGGGTILTASNVRVSHGFTLQCSITDGPNSLEVNWGKRRFHLERLDAAYCGDRPDISAGQPNAGFDVYSGRGTGRLDGVAGATATWVFTDAGEPGTKDRGTLVIRDAGGNVVLRVDGPLLNGGNHQAHQA